MSTVLWGAQYLPFVLNFHELLAARSSTLAITCGQSTYTMNLIGYGVRSDALHHEDKVHKDQASLNGYPTQRRESRNTYVLRYVHRRGQIMHPLTFVC